MSPSGTPISELPLALIPTAAVPLGVRPADHVCVGPGKGSAHTAAGHRPAYCRREIEGEKMTIDAGAQHASPVTLAAARAEFDADVTYLDTATFGLPPRRSWAALQQALAQ
jgi:hypothetical protein